MTLTSSWQLLAFHSFELLVNCRELEETSGKTVLSKLLEAISSKQPSEDGSAVRISLARRQAFSYFASFSRSLPASFTDLEVSCAVMRLLCGIAGKASDLLSELSDLAGGILKLEWERPKVWW